jgi:hypothetical protein
MDNTWHSNKIYIGNGIYRYKCKYENCSKLRMMHSPDDINYNTSIYSIYCCHHYKMMNMKDILIIN